MALRVFTINSGACVSGFAVNTTNDFWLVLGVNGDGSEISLIQSNGGTTFAGHTFDANGYLNPCNILLPPGWKIKLGASGGFCYGLAGSLAELSGYL